MKIHQGWRFFNCYGCQRHWKEACKDYEKQSHTFCPNCHEMVNPYKSERDDTLPVDKYGNLLRSDIEVELKRKYA